MEHIPYLGKKAGKYLGKKVCTYILQSGCATKNGFFDIHMSYFILYLHRLCGKKELKTFIYIKPSLNNDILITSLMVDI